ncbi:hypothetical protein [Streptomyces sp. NPDC057253]|uniref:hypothetical protein n=1 Tax=Streptomyces sp. NPDC057253 TaxID=3346069 RepID=UPI003630B90D
MTCHGGATQDSAASRPTDKPRPHQAGTPSWRGLQPESIGDVVTRVDECAGIEIRFPGHSPRRGLATSSRLKGHDQVVIAKQGGWAPHSKVRAGYLEVVDQWEDNALLGVL